jgi:hypothetical protein
MARPGGRAVTDPSVKGLLVGGVVANLRRLTERGAVSEDALEARLGPRALELLQAKVDPAVWYPIEAYRELVDLLWELEGRREPDYMREKGRAWARKMYEAQRYQQLEYADSRTRSIQSGEEAVRQGRLIASLIQTFWNFVEPKVELAPDRPDTLRFTLEGPLASLFPEANRYTTEGFLNHMVERGGGTHRATSERPTPERIVFHLPLRLGRR